MRWVMAFAGVVVGLAGVSHMFAGAMLAWYVRLGPWWERRHALPAPLDPRLRSDFIIAYGIAIDADAWQADALMAAHLLVGLALIAAGGWLVLAQNRARAG